MCDNASRLQSAPWTIYVVDFMHVSTAQRLPTPLRFSSISLSIFPSVSSISSLRLTREEMWPRSNPVVIFKSDSTSKCLEITPPAGLSL